jgi:hypothetical protein
MKKFLLIALATCALATSSQATSTTEATPVDTLTTDIATRANTTNMNEYDFILARRTAMTLRSAQKDLVMVLDSVTKKIVVKKSPARRKQNAKEEKATPRVETLFDGDTLPGEDRD